MGGCTSQVIPDRGQSNGLIPHCHCTTCNQLSGKTGLLDPFLATELRPPWNIHIPALAYQALSQKPRPGAPLAIFLMGPHTVAFQHRWGRS